MHKAADHGFPYAQFNLGMMYESGQGTLQDYTQAHKWLNLAAALDPDASTSNLAAKAPDLVASKMTPHQIAEAQRMAREWKPR